jgi:catechol 2,3-dioxygenase-like lactoylglutathione lyase family enzyme
MASVLREFVIDCADPERVARWWGEVLGWPVVADGHGYWWSAVTADPDAPPPILTFVPVPEGKTVKNRIHLDLNPSGCDQAEELARLLALGARPVDVGQHDVPWVVLADLEGNELCLLSRRVDQAG